MVTIRCFEEQSPLYEIPLTDRQKESLAGFLTVLRGDEDILPALEEFLVALCEQQPPEWDMDTWRCPMQCYWALRALRDDGNFIPPELFTGWITMTKHLCIMTTALHAINHIGNYTNGLIG
jgi:hypothetical protein